MKYPCKDCEKRTESCHSTCKEYLDVKKKSDQLREEKEKQSVLFQYIAHHRHKTKVKYAMKDKSLKFR